MLTSPDNGVEPVLIYKEKKDKKNGRGDMIRTCDSYVPNVVLYQAELHPDGVTDGL